MAADGSIIIDTSVDGTGLKKGLEQLKGIGDTALKGITASIGAVTAALTAAGTYALKVGSDFEAGMSKVQAISGASGKDLEALTDKAKEMGASTKFSATEAASAMEYMAMAGWKTEDMLSGISGIMDLAAASGESLALTSDIVTDALTGFGMTAADSGRFADILAAASSNANTNVAMMGETFKYVAPVAGALGYNAEDTAVAIGLMANSGIKASQAGTSLRSMLTNLAKPSSTVKKYMDKLNLSLTDTSGEMKPLNSLIVELREKFVDLTEAQKAEYAAGIAGKEAMSGLLAIVTASEADFRKLTDAINNSNGAAAEMAKIMQNNLKGSLVILGSTVEGLGISFYDNIKVSANEAVKSLIQTLSGPEFKGSFNDFSQAAANIIIELSELSQKALPLAMSAFAFLAENLREIVGLAASVYIGFKSFSIISSIAQSVQTMSIAWGAAATKLALYTTANGAAAVTTAALNGTFTATEIIVGALTGKIGLATAAQALWNTVLAANPIGLVVGAIGALVIGVTAYLALTKDSTNATQEFYDSIDELVKSSQEMRETLESNTQQRKKEREEMEKQAGSAKILADRLFSLAERTNKTVGEQQEMLSLVQMLNNAIPELNLAYDAETDSLNKQEDEIRGLIDANLELLKVKAAQEDQAKIAQEIYEAEKKLDDLRQKRFEVVNKLVTLEDELSRATNSYDVTVISEQIEQLNGQLPILNEEIDNTTAVLNASNEEFNQAGEYIQKTAESAEKASDGLDSVCESGSEAADSLEEMGDAGEEAADSLEGLGESGKAAVDSFESVIEGIELTKDEMKTLAEDFVNYEDTATNVFSKVKEESSLSVAEMIANLEANQQAIVEWADNLVLAAERGVDQGLLMKLQEAGPQAAGYVRALVDASDEEIKRLNEAFESGTEAACNASNAQLIIWKGEAGQLTRETVDGMADELNKGIYPVQNAAESMKNGAIVSLEGLKFATKEIASESVNGMTGELRNGSSEMSAIGEDWKNSLLNALSDLRSRLVEIGRQAANGLSEGINQQATSILNIGADMADRVVKGARRKAEIHSPSRLVAREVGVPMAEGIGLGFEKALPEMEHQMQVDLNDMAARMESAVSMESSVAGTNSAAIQNYSTANSSNTDIGGINIQVDYHGGGMAEDADILARRLGQKTNQALRAKGVYSLGR